MAPIFRDFGAFIAYAVEEVSRQDASGWFRYYGYK
jgi:hypothetical protein